MYRSWFYNLMEKHRNLVKNHIFLNNCLGQFAKPLRAKISNDIIVTAILFYIANLWAIISYHKSCQHKNQRATNGKIYFFSLCNLIKKMIQKNLFTRQKQTHKFWNQTYDYQMGNMEGINCKFGINIYTLLYIKYIGNKDLWYSTGNSTQYSLVTDMGKESDKEWIYIYIYIAE